MSLFTRSSAPRASVDDPVQAENPTYPMTSETLLQFLGAEKSHTGKRVDEVTALGMSAVWRAVQLSSNVPASLPFHAFATKGAARVSATGQGARLLEDPHPDMTAFELWQTVYVHRKLWGNAYLRKLRNQLGQVAELWPVHPARVKVGRESEGGRKVYAIDGGKEVLSDREILHLPGMGYDGVCGVSPVRAARQSIGLGLAAEEYGAKLFGSGSLATGILQTEQRLTQTQADRLSKRWKDGHVGLDSAHETIVMDKGAKFIPLTIPPADAQFLESRRFQIVEMCRWFGIPPFLMFETEKSTSWGTGLEQQALGWVKFDLGPDLISVEQRVTKHVLSPAPVYAKYGLEGLLRGDSVARAAFYTSMWNLGVLSTNEIRAYEEQAPVEGGDTRYRPLNMGELGTTDTGGTTSSANPTSDSVLAELDFGVTLPPRYRKPPEEAPMKPLYRFHGSTPPQAGARTPVLDVRAEAEVPEVIDGVAKMRIYDPIDSWGGDWGVSAKEFTRALDLLPDDTTEIHLHLNSPGGEVWEATTILNALRRHSARVVAIVDGLAASAASYLATGADELVMGRNTQLMIHDAWGLCVGNAADMRDTGGRLDQLSDNIASIYATKAGGTTETWRAAMLAESWYSPDEAVAAGLADRVEGTKADDAKAFDTKTLFNHAGRVDAPPPVIPGTPESDEPTEETPAAALQRRHAMKARARKMRAAA